MSSPQVGTQATVLVTSAWYSRVNWTQAVAAAASVLTIVTGGKIGLTFEQQSAIVLVIQLLCNLATYIMHTFYTPGVKAASLT
jgi:hypothetical protein